MKISTFKIAIIAFLILSGIKQSCAQSTPWVVGLGSSVLYDAGGMKNLFNVGEAWNITPYPSRLNVEKIIGNGFSVEFVGSFNKFKAGKLGAAQKSTVDRSYMSFDLLAKYNFDELLGGGTKYFSPFIMAGYGYYTVGNGKAKNNSGVDYTINGVGSMTSNMGLGWNTWLTDNIGLNFQSTAKFINNKKASNHLHHSAAIIFRFGGNSDFSDKKYNRVMSGDVKSASEHLRSILRK